MARYGWAQISGNKSTSKTIYLIENEDTDGRKLELRDI